jgi:hypothetical protein
VGEGRIDHDRLAEKVGALAAEADVDRLLHNDLNS